MNKKISLGLAISLIAIASAVTFILTSFFSLQSFNEKVVDVNQKAKKYNSLQLLDTFIRDNYYGDINEADLNDGILKGYVDGLGDPYSRYLSEEEYIDEQSENAGEIIGLGLTLAEDESGYIRIEQVLENSPAAEVGIIAGDAIIHIDGTDVTEIGFDEAVETLKGSEGTSVKLTVRRNGIDTGYDFTRRSIEVTSVTGRLIDGYIGYIKIDGFKENTSEQFVELLQRLTSNGAKALVFDLRDNPGGLVTSLEECLDPLLPEGKIAIAEYRDGHSETLVYSDSSELDMPMAVIMNGETASSAELFAAALKDFDKAQLIGEQSYGKGVMQSTTKFESGGAVVLTVAEYRTVKSECYDGVGLAPDYPIQNEDEGVDSQLDKALEIVDEELAEQ